MPSMPGDWRTGIRSLYPADDRGGEVIQGDTDGVGQMYQVW